MQTPRHLAAPVLAASLLSLSSTASMGCGAAKAVRPDAPTGNEAMGGGRCDPKAQSTNVFAVDLPPETRSDLELELSGGALAVVSFNCNQLKILKTCKANGEYKFHGTSAKERVLSLESGDEIRAALPLGGAGIAAAFEAEASSGTKFDLGLVLSGQMVGSSASFSAAELTGNCSGATHVVTAGKMGAFAMGTSAKAEMRTAAQVFGAGLKAGSTASKLTKSRDGSLEACDASEAGADNPPKGCDALLVLEVTKLDGSLGDVDVGEIGDIMGLALYSDLSCNELPTCERECNGGRGRGCTSLGVSLVEGGNKENPVDKNIPKGRQLLKKGCDLGDMKGCAALAEVLSYDDKRIDEGIGYAEKACNVGNDDDACFTLHTLYERKGDNEKSTKYKNKACNLSGPESYYCK